METKAGKNKNLVKDVFVKKLSNNMKIFSKEEVIIKTDSKLTANEKKKKGDSDKKFKMKKGKV